MKTIIDSRKDWGEVKCAYPEAEEEGHRFLCQAFLLSWWVQRKSGQQFCGGKSLWSLYKQGIFRHLIQRLWRMESWGSPRVSFSLPLSLPLLLLFFIFIFPAFFSPLSPPPPPGPFSPSYSSFSLLSFNFSFCSMLDYFDTLECLFSY